MPKSFIEVEDEYKQFKAQNPDDPTPLGLFAKQLDELQGVQDRAEAYNDAWYKKANALVDRGFRATGLPEVTGAATGAVGRGFDSLVGTNIAPTVETIGRDLPRMVTESLLTIPEAASGVGLPVAAATVANRVNQLRKVLGYGGAALSGASSTDSPVLGSVIGAGSMFAGNKLLLPAERGGMDVAGRTADALRERLGMKSAPIVAETAKDLTSAVPEVAFDPANTLKNMLATSGGVAAEGAAAVGLNEATRQAQLSVGPNAVGALDPARNPLTPENIAGNVVNAGMMAPQLIHGVRSASGFDPRQAKPLADWIRTRREAVEQTARSEGLVNPEQVHDAEGTTKNAPVYAAGEQPTLDLKESLAAQPRFGEADEKKLTTSIRTYLDAAREFERQGKPFEAERSIAQAKQTLDALGKTEADLPAVQTTVKEIDAQARMMSPNDPQGLVDFVNKVNSVIDYYNENRVKIEEGEMPASPVGTPEQSSHPEARDPSVVTRLQDKGVLPKITPEWLKETWNATFDDLGNPQFAQDVMAQKVANHLLDRVPEALKNEPTTPVVSQPSPQVAKIDAQESAFFNALSKFPESLQDALINQTIRFRKSPDKFVQGRQMNRYDSWQRAIITAAKTYDPVSQTAEIYRAGKLIRGSIANLWSKDYEPVLTPVKPGAGGKGKVTVSGKTIPEGNLESMVTPENIVPEGELSVTEQAGQAGLAGDATQGALFRKTGDEGVAPVEDLPIAAETQKAFDDRFYKQSESLRKTLATITPEQAWDITKSFVSGVRSDATTAFWKDNAKLVLEALVENSTTTRGDKIGPVSQKFLDTWHAFGFKQRGVTVRDQLMYALNRAFRDEKPVEGVSTFGTNARNEKIVTNTRETALARQRQILDRLLNPKAVETSKNWQGPMRMAEDAVQPKVGEGTVTGAGSDDLLVNHPKPGDFARDVERSVDAYLGKLGYSGDFRSLALAAARAVLKETDKLPADFYRISGRELGLANYDLQPGRAQVGLQLPDDTPPSVAGMHRILSVLNHELAHIDDFVQYGMLNAPDAYSQERKRQLDNLSSMFEALDENERRAVLLTLDEGVRPPGFRNTLRDGGPQLQAATTNVDEFSATIRQIVSDSLLWGKEKGLKTALETLDYSPTEVQEHAQFQYRTIRDVFQGLMETLADPKIREAAKRTDLVGKADPFTLSKAFGAVVSAAEAGAWVRDSMWDVRDTSKTISSMSPGAATTPPPEITSATWFRKRQEIGKYHPGENHSPYAMANAEDAIGQARQTLGLAYDKDKKPGVWARWLYPFGQLMYSMERSGVDLARPLFNLVNDTEAAIHRRYSDIVSPFIKQRSDGTIKWDDEHPLIRGLAGKTAGQVREGFNRVSQWQTENASQSMFSEVEGRVLVNESAQTAWDKIKSQLSAADQQVVMAGSVAADKIGANEAKHTLSVLDEVMTLRTASLLQMTNRRLTYDQAYSMADRITEAYQTGQVLSLPGTGLDPAILGNVDKLLGGTEGLIAQFQKVSEMLSKRPGYRTEQLPHDWVIMYENAVGETKFASAPTEKQAQYVLNREIAKGGKQVGEILNRTDLRSKYQSFDDPDVLLKKFSQIEGKTWDNVVEDARVKFGEEVADELKASFTPGATSLKDISSQGFSKFLKPAKSQIDRTSFDYLDAMFARAARLSASASYKTHGMMKDLILNDPRGRMFPSLGQMVNDHWDNMLAPTSDLTKKVKALTTGYFLGANLSSAALEGTQSIMTVIPTLIGTNDSGGPVKAYGQLFQSIADATKISTSSDWQTRATQAEAKVRANPDQKLTPDETRAMLYRRAVADGIIGHGVIEDLVFQGDQKSLQTAKFGRGDYGPAPVSELVTNPLYMGTKMMMGLYSPVARFNDKISFFAGLNQGIEKGLTGDDLYNHARQFKTLTTFGGGKANAPGVAAKFGKAGPEIRSAFGMVNTLQQYGYGMVALYAQFAKDSIDNSKSLTPAQRRQARKAFGTMLGTQLAIGGALGVPFAGATLTLIEKLFGVPANQLVREGLASLGSDDEEGGVIAETALNGFPNQMFGLDVSSRVGVSNLLGTSAYRGFSVQDMLGPVPSVVTNMAQSLGWFGQGETVKGIHSLVPNAFKNLVSMADTHRKYGDLAIRDSSENLQYTPTDGESFGRALGFRPRVQSQRSTAAGLLSNADKRAVSEEDRIRDGLAQRLLQGDPVGAQQYARNVHYSDPTVNERDVLRSVMERAVRASREKDLLASGSRVNADERARIMGTFGPDVNPRQSETGLEQLRMQLAAQLGNPDLMPHGRDWSRAAVVDKLTSQGMVRSQAVALARFLGL